MTRPGTHEQLQRAIYEEVAALVYAETHQEARRTRPDPAATPQEQEPPAAEDVPDAPGG